MHGFGFVNLVEYRKVPKQWGVIWSMFCDDNNGNFSRGLVVGDGWHRRFDVNGSWARAGGVQPGNWPDWMKNFKDY